MSPSIFKKIIKNQRIVIVKTIWYTLTVTNITVVLQKTLRRALGEKYYDELEEL